MLTILLLSFLCSVPGAGLPTRVNIHGPVPAIAYVSKSGNDQTARPGKSGNPFFTVTAALAAIPAAGGTLVIGPGEFESPKQGSMKSHIILVGSGKPEPDWTAQYDKVTGKIGFTIPQKLIGGTILKGTLDCSLLDHIIIKDLGVDVGALWCKEYNQHKPAEGLIFAQKYNLKGGLSTPDGIHELQILSPPRHGILVQNVSVLCRDAEAAVHAMLFENLFCPQIINVSTYYGVHGVVLKTQGGLLTNMHAYGHFSNGLILKSNNYAFGNSTSVNNVYISSITPGDGGGIRLVGADDTLKHISITNFVVENTRFGITNNGPVDGAILANGHLLDCSDYSIAVDSNVSHSIFSNIVKSRKGQVTIYSLMEHNKVMCIIK